MAVNVSAVQVAQQDFLDRVAGVLEKSGLAAGLLELELTETALIANLEHARTLLTGLKRLGVQVAIDDFGVGYANMNYLKNLAIDRLKMDRAFVSGIDTSGRDRAISAAIISMARSMNLRITAEGIEDDEQLDVLQAQGCDDVQGHLVARPMSAARAEAYLRSHEASRDAAPERT
jgi:EAL domain-containing protein (putative c-di-GMP-specific phosphodiesterase class I)